MANDNSFSTRLQNDNTVIESNICFEDNTPAIEYTVIDESESILSENIPETVTEQLEPVIADNRILVSEDSTMYMDKTSMFSTVTDKTVKGNGCICWENWKNDSKDVNFDGNLWIPYINDSIYTSMKLPSELNTLIDYAANPRIMNYKPKGCINAVGIGSVYQALDTGELPEKFSVCIGKMKTYVLYEGEDEQWQVLDDYNFADSIYHFKLYKLPWSTRESKDIDKEKFQVNDGYMKITLSKWNLYHSTMHFWAQKQDCYAKKVVGFVNIYEIWTDTPEASGKLVATIGVDQRDKKSNIFQAFSGRNYAITNQKRLIIGHSLPDDVYEWCVNNGKSPEKCLEMFYRD